MQNLNLNNLPESTRLLVVSKGRTSEEVQAAVEIYNSNLVGASRWQELRSKFFIYSEESENSYPLQRQEWAKQLELHFIGRLQSNKLKYLVPHFDCIQSVASVELLPDIDRVAERNNKKQDIMLQVNVSDDELKAGIGSGDIEEALAIAAKLENIQVTGLMTITAQQSEVDTRKDYRTMKQLQQKSGLKEVSMGMSNDWQIAVEEGATIIRVGSALYRQP